MAIITGGLKINKTPPIIKIGALAPSVKIKTSYNNKPPIIPGPGTDQVLPRMYWS